MILAESNETVNRGHFARPVLEAARDLIGRALIVVSSVDQAVAVVVETEAYAGADDPASHASFRPGGRASVMAGEPGIIYVYAAYGMYPCLNIVTGEVGTPSAVLVRGVWIAGAERPVLGPGRTTRALGITLDDHGTSIDAGRIRVSTYRQPAEIIMTPRIGIRRGMDLPWRFIDSRVKQVSR